MMLIKNARVLTMAGRILEKGDILIGDGKIKEIGENIGVKDGMEVIDVDGKMVTPGFIDAHCHLGLDEDSIGFEGADYNESVDPITPHLRAIDSINPMDVTLKEAYEGGITSVNTGQGSANVIGGQFLAMKTYGKRIDDMVIKFPSAMKVAFGENPKRVYSGQGRSPATRMGTAGLLREALNGARFYLDKKEKAAGDVREMPAFDIKKEALIPVIKKEIPLKAHAHRADDIYTALRLAREMDVDITLDHCTEGHLIADDLAEEGKPAIVGPTFGHRTKHELINTDFKTPAVLNQAGVKIAITTDSPVIPVHHLPLCAGLAIGAGLDEMEAFKAITIYPAEIIGIDDRVGSLEVGKDADLVVFDGHPLLDLDYQVDKTFIDGRMVYNREE